jgi:hypothetical protein
MRLAPITLAAALSATAVLLPAGTAQAQQDAYDGWYWNRAAGYWQGRDIWGNGPYGTGLYGQPGPGGLVEWQGAGTHPANLGIWLDTPTTVGFESAPAGQHWGQTYSGGNFSLPAAAAFPAVVKASFHLYSVLGDNPGGEATFTNADISGSFYTNNSQWPRAPLHWRVDYRMDIEGTEFFIGSASVVHPGLATNLGAGAGSFVGILDEVPQGFSTQLIVPFSLTVGAGDRGGLPATGRTDVWVDIYLSRSPIPATPVPEPGSWALMLAGLAAAGTLARRRAATMRG